MVYCKPTEQYDYSLLQNVHNQLLFEEYYEVLVQNRQNIPTYIYKYIGLSHGHINELYESLYIRILMTWERPYLKVQK